VFVAVTLFHWTIAVCHRMIETDCCAIVASNSLAFADLAIEVQALL
jgi:hypothetical protein